MTTVTFHCYTADPLTYACRLLRKAVATGAKVIVTGAEQTLLQLDKALWTFSATDFVPHCDLSAPPGLQDRSPVVFASSLASVPHHAVLLNLCEQVPPEAVQFDRVIEIVSLADPEQQKARLRWKQYKVIGCDRTRHDIAPRAAE